ncbi:complement resistance protein TraT [Candidatus Bandiella numerosa]|uniref:complement resistance protein TraT n=1 Tax=Candidatus Bandiella numerosa TaxID=2570586 RepID=UPI00249E2AD4|nr:complement resistance protein TraT [Candidatus Bandiella numerosa]WHA04542.1 complement resistance protein TraT [Candidatus Bandiella numerosa]
MHCIESLYGEYHIEELCAGKLQARFCRGSYNTNSKFQNNFNEEYNVMTSTRQTIFLDPIDDNKKTVLLQIRNTSDKSGLEIESKIRSAIESKGYRIVNSTQSANIMIQANVLQVGKNTLENPFQALTGGYGSGLEGFATGAAIAGATGGSGRSMLGIGLITGIGNTVLDAAVEVVNFTMITDLQISEKADGEYVSESSDANLKQGTSGYKKSRWEKKTNWKKYQTRIMSVAKKTNLKFEEAEPKLTEGLVKSISGLL